MKKVFVEGIIDVAFVRALGIPRKNVRALDSKGEVIKHLEKLSGAIGLVDEDPAERPSKYLRSLKKEELKHGLLLYFDNKNNNKTVVLCPRFEEWLLNIAKQAKLQMSDFYLPDKAETLHKELPRHLPKLEKVVAHLLELKNPALLLLQSHLLEK